MLYLGCVGAPDFPDQGKPASANLQAIVSVQIMRMFDNFDSFSDLSSMMLLLPCDN